MDEPGVIIDSLDRRFGAASCVALADLPVFCERFAECMLIDLANHLRATICNTLTAQGSEAGRLSSGEIAVNGRVLRLFVGTDPENASRLLISLTPCDGTSGSISMAETLALAHSSQHKAARLVSSMHGSALSTAFQAALPWLNTSYSWLEQFCIKAINQEQDKLIDELYRIIRTALGDETRERVWLYFLSRKGCVYIFDRCAQLSALQSARGLSRAFGKAPVEIVTTLASFVADAECTSDFKVVIPQDSTYLHDPLHGVNDGDEISIPQFVLFGGESLMVQPLVGKEAGDLSKGVSWLTAAYPPQIRDEVENRLKSIRPMLRKTLTESASLREGVAQRFRRSSNGLPWGAIGEFMAGYIKGSL